MELYTLLFLFINLTLVLCNSDCESLSSFFKKNDYEMRNDCCNEPGIECEDNYIKSLNITLQPGKIDFSSFPKFERIKFLSIKGDVYEGVLPLDKFFGISNLDFSHSSLKKVSIEQEIDDFLTIDELMLNNNLFETFPEVLKKIYMSNLNLDNNKISGSFEIENGIGTTISLKNNNFTGEFVVPTIVRNLYIDNNHIDSLIFNDYSNLEELYGSNNNFGDKIFDELKDLTLIKKIVLSGNKNINMVKRSIGKLTTLKNLDLSHNNIKQLHSDIFMLNNLETFDISENPNLNINIINFAGKIPIKNCNFTNVQGIHCYQPNTCENINDNDYKICTEEEISNVKKEQTLNSGHSIIKILTLGFFSILFIIICIYLSVARENDDNNNIGTNTTTTNNNNRSGDDNDDCLPPYEEGIALPSYSSFSNNNNNNNNNNINEDINNLNLPTYEEAININDP